MRISTSNATACTVARYRRLVRRTSRHGGQVASAPHGITHVINTEVQMELGTGTVVVITGAASGIGLAFAESFARAGCSIVLADIQDDALRSADEQIAALGVDTLSRRTDVSKPDELAALATATIERFGKVNVLCNNAGVAGGGDPWFGGLESWEWVMGVNFWGVVHGVRAFLPHLVASGSAHIVNTASMAGLMPGFSPQYDASKHAVVAISEGLFNMTTNAALPVGVSCLCPGWVRTAIVDAQRNWPEELGAAPVRDAAAEVVMKHVARAVDEGMQPAAVADRVVQAVREGRFWVFPQRDFLDIAVERFHRIADELDPAPGARQIPGLPPRDQLMAEVMAALSGDQA
jgi:NAD(P)-dependent dehydrogenase (short-subunit alcohol dehydrogenase family)